MTLTVRVDADDSRSAEHLLKDGWTEDDVLETYVLHVGIETPRQPSFITQAGLKNIEECISVANAAFSPKDKTDWVRDAFNRQDRLVFVENQPDRTIGGFIIIRQEPKTMVIDLIATKFNRHGIGSALIWFAWWNCPRWRAGTNYYLSNTMIKAGTQSTNEAARNFYRKLGFVSENRKRTFRKCQE